MNWCRPTSSPKIKRFCTKIFGEENIYTKKCVIFTSHSTYANFTLKPEKVWPRFKLNFMRKLSVYRLDKYICLWCEAHEVYSRYVGLRECACVVCEMHVVVFHMEASTNNERSVFYSSTSCWHSFSRVETQTNI